MVLALVVEPAIVQRVRIPPGNCRSSRQQSARRMDVNGFTKCQRRTDIRFITNLEADLPQGPLNQTYYRGVSRTNNILREAK